MDVPIHAEVSCADGPCGESDCIILNPVTDQITHFVVQEKSFPYEKRLVPVNRIKETTSDRILLDCNLNEFAKMVKFIETEFLVPDPYKYTLSPTMVWPYTTFLEPITLQHEQIPPDELAIHRGAAVEASDGRIGQVDEFLVDPKSGFITHLVLREGHLWGKKDVTIPISKIDRIERDIVYLKINKQETESLPAIPIRKAGSV
jgi:uncharacterized protein YrrD